MTSFTYSAPGGRASLTARSSSPDPNRRFSVTMSDGFMIGADGLRGLGEQLIAFADQNGAKAPAKKKAAPKAEASE